MRLRQHTQIVVAIVLALAVGGLRAYAVPSSVQLGPRPFYLVERLSEGDLKHKLAACVADMQSYLPHDFSIGHRGAGLQFLEHTQEAYEAGRRWARVSSNAT
jgi:glycerophosphoryl diester phosphodiesterase